MNPKIAICICFFLFAASIAAQDTKYIEVTGSAEMFVDPDEFLFIIGIEEYWKEELDPKKEFKDYKNKVAIADIESELLKDLSDLGIQKQSIKSTEVGNTWRYRGKDFLISKRLEITLTDFQIINQIIAKLNTRGVDYMRIGELKNKNLLEYRKEVKKKALLAAKEKATYLLETIDKKLGDVLFIQELNSDHSFWSPSLTTSNTLVQSPNNDQANNEKKIKLRFEINARFEIQ